MLIPNINKSIYDFHDDSEREEDCFNLSIDETPKKPKKITNTSLGPLKMKLSSKLTAKTYSKLIYHEK